VPTVSDAVARQWATITPPSDSSRSKVEIVQVVMFVSC